jgi:cation diffusion facilitator family transporter
MIEDKHTTKKNAALFSMGASLFMTLSKFVVGFLTGSLGIISEAIHSLVDFMATIVTYFAVKISSEPADHNHHYGHDKVESLAALVETGLLFGTSLWIMYEAALRIFGKSEGHVEVTWYALLVIIISISIDFNRSRSLLKVAKATGSQALEADALHFASDMYSSLAVLIGLMLTYFGVTFADSLSACLVSVMIFSAGINLGKKSLAVLMDEAPAGVSAHICKLAKTVTGVTGVHDVNVRSLDGTRIFTDLSIYIDGSKTLREASIIKQEVENLIASTYEGGHIIVHIDTAKV